MKKAISIMISAMMLVMLFAMPVFAFDLTVTPTPIDKATTAVGNVLGLVQWIGYAIAIGMLIYVGIKYVTASANEKAELKNSMVRYIVGALLIAGASTIAGWIFNSSIIG